MAILILILNTINMKKIIYILIFLPFFGSSQYTSIPDSAFEAKLITLGLDNAWDGQVLTASVDTVTNLDVNCYNCFDTLEIIYDLTGIEAFDALENLNSSYHFIDNLNLSSNTNLINVNLKSNSRLTLLELNGNPNLVSLDIRQCSSLDFLSLNGASNLTTFYEPSSGMITANFNGCSSLTELDLTPGVSDVNLNGCTSLTDLEIQNLPIFLNNNPNISSLDISSCSSLNEVVLRFTAINCFNAKNGNSNLRVRTYFDTTISCIEVNDTNIANSNNWIIEPNVSLSTDCSFANNCFDFTSVVEQSTKIRVYPNPTSNLINIDVPGFENKVNVELYDINGRLLETSNNVIVSLKNYQRGIYLLKVSYGEKTELIRVLRD